jgi:hypothetical protein
MSIFMTGEGSSTSHLAVLTDVGTVASDFDSSWPFFPIGLASITAANRGRLGTLFDCWWRQTGVADADTFPNDAAARQFVAMGPWILPWTGDGTAPLIT